MPRLKRTSKRPGVAVRLHGAGDPIFAAIERYERAMAKVDLIWDEPPETEGPDREVRMDEAAGVAKAARLALANTVPTTLAGLAELARFLNHQSNTVFETSFFDEEMGELLPFFETLDRCVAGIVAAGASAARLTKGGGQRRESDFPRATL
jgi:hypothetical protein